MNDWRIRNLNKDYLECLVLNYHDNANIYMRLIIDSLLMVFLMEVYYSPKLGGSPYSIKEAKFKNM